MTHRDINSAVTLVTGHSFTGAVPDDLDWPALARGAPVLVFYMALRHLDEICRRLIEAGRPTAEPVAIVARATTPDQQVIETTLAMAPADGAAVAPPAVVVVGEVVRLRAGLDWLGALAGRSLEADPLGTGRAPADRLNRCRPG